MPDGCGGPATRGGRGKAMGAVETPTRVQTDEQGTLCCPACGRAEDVALYSLLDGPGHGGPRAFPFDSMHVELGFHCGTCGYEWDLGFVPQLMASGRRRTVLELRPRAGKDEGRGEGRAVEGDEED
jgi:hypothetical protein